MEPVQIEMSIPCISEFVGIVRLAVSGIATRMNFNVEDIEDIKIAVSEACTNSVQYAYEKDSSKRIFITCNMYSDKLEIIVKDEGKGFDVTKSIPHRIDEPEPDRLGLGLGITFIKSLMDDADIQSVIGQGTTVTMLKVAPEVKVFEK